MPPYTMKGKSIRTDDSLLDSGEGGMPHGQPIAEGLPSRRKALEYYTKKNIL